MSCVWKIKTWAVVVHLWDTLTIPAPKRLIRVTKSKHASGVGTTMLEQIGKYQNLILRKKIQKSNWGEVKGSSPPDNCPWLISEPPGPGHLDTLTNVTCSPAGVYSILVNSLLVFLCFTLILKRSFLFLNNLFLRKHSSLAAFPQEQFPGREGCRSWKSHCIRYWLSCSEAPSTLKHCDKLYFFILP